MKEFFLSTVTIPMWWLMLLFIFGIIISYITGYKDGKC